MTFKELGLVKPLLQALETQKHITPTAIQEKAIPHILNKQDLLGCDQTGTGKTAAFALPIIQRLLEEQIPNDREKKVKVLILSPTRELAIQTRDNFRKYGANTSLKTSVVLGGVNKRSQINVLRNGVDILIATPGRLLDLLNDRYVKLNNVEMLVLDEVDTLLDMGFIIDVRKIIAHTPSNRQTMLFSATLPPRITNLAKEFTQDRITVKVTPDSSTVKTINQSLYYVDKANKPDLLTDILVKDDVTSSLVFARTKHGADKLAQRLDRIGIQAGVIHGDKSQNARIRALDILKQVKAKY
jgi:ATP-dependent RNA helicase RhlE